MLAVSGPEVLKAAPEAGNRNPPPRPPHRLVASCEKLSRKSLLPTFRLLIAKRPERRIPCSPVGSLKLSMCWCQETKLINFAYLKARSQTSAFCRVLHMSSLILLAVRHVVVGLGVPDPVQEHPRSGRGGLGKTTSLGRLPPSVLTRSVVQKRDGCGFVCRCCSFAMVL